MLEALAGVGEALEQCHPWALSGESLVSGLDDIVRVQCQLEALRLEFVHEIDAQGVARAQGASSTGVWLRNRCRTWPAKQTVELAAWLHDEGAPTASALAAGDLNAAQAQVIAKAMADLPTERRIEAQHAMIKEARALDPIQLGKIGDRLFEHLNPDGVEQREADRLKRAERRATDNRSLTLTDNGDGRIRVTGWLTPVAAAAVTEALDPLCKPGAAGVDGRTATQRRADALVAVCRLSLKCGNLPDNGGDRPQVVITMRLETLRDQIGAATLDTGSRLSATEARLAACDAGIVPAVLGGRGQILDVGRERRTFTGPLRRALVLRDGGCAFPGCDRPPRWADGHHIKHWADGGPTCLANAVLLCGHHHRLIHRGEWEVRINPGDGLPEFLPPSYMDKHRTPLRDHYHKRN
jgi:Domain of unknown function (DUF222)